MTKWAIFAISLSALAFACGGPSDAAVADPPAEPEGTTESGEQPSDNGEATENTETPAEGE